MIRFHALALGFTALGSATFALPNGSNGASNGLNSFHPAAALAEPVAASEGEDDWLELDREIERLESFRRTQSDGLGWSVLFRGAFVVAHESIATNNPAGTPGVNGTRSERGTDVAGIDFNDLDVAFWGRLRQYGWRLSFDVLGDDEISSTAQGGGNTTGGITFDSGDEIQLEDAYVYWDWGDIFRVTVGHFKFPMTYGASIDPENQLFIDRTALSSFLDVWQAGVMFQGDIELPDFCGGTFLRWIGAFQDGRQAAIKNAVGFPTIFQDAESDPRYALRVEFDAGNGAGAYEGARRSNDKFNATLGLTISKNEQFAGKGSDTIFTADLNGDYRSFGFGFEFANLGDAIIGPVTGDYGHLNVNNPLNMAVAGGSPYAAMLSYLISPELEIGVRLEELDNGGVINPLGGPPALGPDNRVISYTINWYRSGNNAKWQFGYTTISSNSFGDRNPASFDEGGYFQLALTVGATR